MGPQAKRALLSNQKDNEELQYVLDIIAAGKASSKFPTPTKVPFIRTALPITVPYLRTSNPFCPVTDNKTGWEEWRLKKIEDPKVMGKHQIGGTDPNPPKWPIFR